MGIAVRELLALEYFKDFEVVAGRGGVHKEIQGISCLEAPDAFNWVRGRELVFSSGYVIMKEPGCIQKGFEQGYIQPSSGLLIKRGRYLDEIPTDIIRLFDEYDVPLITMPFEVPWMEMINQINTAVMNRTVRRFRIQNTSMFQPSNQTYKMQKIKRILQAVEVEMNFLAFVYDTAEERSYYSSVNFRRITESFGLKESDYIEPSYPYTQHNLCDYINMVRFRLLNPDNAEGPRISWIRIPIIMNGVERAYFVVMESREFIDYYDEYSIRIAFLMLQAVYEQLEIARSVGNVGFENFIHFAMSYGQNDRKRLVYQANVQGISMSEVFTFVVFRQCSPALSTYTERKKLMEIFQTTEAAKRGKLVLLEENEGALLLQAGDAVAKDKEGIIRLLEEFRMRVTAEYPEMELEFGICREEKTLAEVRPNIEKCRKVLKMGKLLYPKEYIWDYEMLGPLAWLQIPEEELEEMLSRYKALMHDEKNIELLRTLKVYLENNMNYSLTAEKMYVHINTIRKRIDKVNSLLDMTWERHIDRLKVEMLLQFLDLP
ncbi:MAG: PucR family transcriptional regulator [Coprococcus sp.]|nr:PucR family transcriptional regulator [Coprococcus sp.]